MRLSDEELVELEAVFTADMVDVDTVEQGAAGVLALEAELRSLRALLATPWPAESQFELVPLDGGIYLSNRDNDGIEDIADEHLVGMGAALIRAGLAAMKARGGE